MLPHHRYSVDSDSFNGAPSIIKSNPKLLCIYFSLQYYLKNISISLFLSLLFGNILLNTFHFYYSNNPLTLNLFFYASGYIALSFFYLSIIPTLSLFFQIPSLIFTLYLFSLYTQDIIKENNPYFNFIYILFSILPLAISLLSFKKYLIQTSSKLFPKLHFKDQETHFSFFLNTSNFSEHSFSNFILFLKQSKNQVKISDTLHKWQKENSKINSSSSLELFTNPSIELFHSFNSLNLLNKNYENILSLYHYLLISNNHSLNKEIFQILYKEDPLLIENIHKATSKNLHEENLSYIKIYLSKLHLDLSLPTKATPEKRKLKI